MNNPLNIEPEPFEYYSEIDDYESEFDTGYFDREWEDEAYGLDLDLAPVNQVYGEQTPDITFEYMDQEAHSGSTRQVPKTIRKKNTDLNAPYRGGNFNFFYKGGASQAFITFKTRLKFRKNFSKSARSKFIKNLKSAVKVWDNAAEVQVKDKNGKYSDRIKLRFLLKFVKKNKDSNKKTDVHPSNTRAVFLADKGRENVIRDLNVFINSSRNVLIHEMGHVWGLLDENDTRLIEKIFSPGHVGRKSPLLKDKKAIMNIGYGTNSGEFRGRYFKHFGRAILNAFWGVKKNVIPVKHKGRIVSRTVQGRIVLLKKDIAGSKPFAKSVPPFNPFSTIIQVAKR